MTLIVSNLAAKAPLDSPTFTGDPKAPTPAPGDSDTSIATTAFVQGAVTIGASPPSRVNLDTVAALAADGVTDQSLKINAYLLSAGAGIYDLGKHSAAYWIANPVIGRNGQEIRGQGAWQGGSTLLLDPVNYPHTTISGDQTMPALTATSFTLNVTGGTGATRFPMGATGQALQHGQGILAVPGFRIFYTGISLGTGPGGADQFTGCRVNAGGVSKTLTNGRVVSTPVVWEEEPAATSVGFGCRIADVGIDFNDAPGACGIWTCHAQEGGGYDRIRYAKYRLFGYAEDSNPTLAGNDQPVNNGPNGAAWLIASSSAEPEAYGIDVMLDNYGAAGKFGSVRPFQSITAGVQGSATQVGTAAIRVNGASLRILDIHLENEHVGVMIGDVYPSVVEIDNIGTGSGWGNGANDSVVQIVGDGSTVSIRQALKDNPLGVPQRQLVVDIPNGFRSIDATLNYERWPGGAYRVNGGWIVGLDAARPVPGSTLRGAGFMAKDTGNAYLCDGGIWIPVAVGRGAHLVQDSVCTGARDNTSSTTLTVTFAKATTVGNTVLVSCGSSGNFVLSSAVDSRGNAPVVDAAPASTQGTSSNILRIPVTTAHQVGDTLTLTFAGADTYAYAIGEEFAGMISPGSPVDQTASNNGSTGSPNTGTATTLHANELLYAGVAYNNATPVTAGPGFTGLASQSSGAGNRTITPEYRVVGATGSFNAFWTGQPGSYQAAMVTYQVNPPTSISLLSLAPLANPVFTGDPQAPTPVSTDNDTSLATTAFVQTVRRKGEAILYSDGNTFTPFPFSALHSAGGPVAATNGARGLRWTCPKTGTLSKLYIGVVASSGNIEVAVLDTGDASAGNRSRLWHSGTTACGGANAYQAFAPALAVTKDVDYEFAIAADNTTATFLRVQGGLASNSLDSLPSDVNAVPGGATWKPYSIVVSGAGVTASPFAINTTVSEAQWTVGGFGFFFIGLIT